MSLEAADVPIETMKWVRNYGGRVFGVRGNMITICLN